MPFIDIGSAALRYQTSGNGSDLIVLIHELGGTLESWDAVLPRLTGKMRVLTYDMRGAGCSEKLRGPVSYQEMAADLAALLDALDMDEPVFLAGPAVGAGIALAFSAAYPERTRGVVAMSPSAWVAEEHRPFALALVERIAQGGLRDKVEMAVAPAFPPSLAIDPAIYRDYVAQWLGNDPQSYAELYRMLVNSTLREQLADIRCPVLAIAGTHDVVRPSALVAETVALIPGAMLIELPSGHFMPVQTPNLVAAEILKFVDAYPFKHAASQIPSS